jgi:tetratricopeptide (TPR) repeat protein
VIVDLRLTSDDDRRRQSRWQGDIRHSKIVNRQYVWIVCLLLSSSVLQGQSIDWPRVHSLTVHGIDQLYALQIDEAEKSFDEVTRMAPEDPRGWFFKSMVHFYVYQLSKDEAAYKRFFELSETVIEKAEALVDRDANDLNAKFYLGGIYGYRGLAYQRNGSVLAGVWDGRKGYGLLKEAATGPNLSVDAQLGFGLFSYLIAKIPRSFSWVLNLIGFSGDLEGGLTLMKAAADRGIYTRTEASFYYAQFCFFEERYDQAEIYLRRIIDQYPTNSLFLVTYATWELRRDRIDSAIAVGERAIAINEKAQVKIGDEFAHSTLASAYFTNGRFVEAADHWERFIERSENKENVGNFVYYRLGIVYELLGQRARAIATWNRMKKTTDTDEPWESVYWRRAQILLASPLAPVDVAILLASNEAQRGNRTAATEMYRTAVHLSAGDPERQSQAYYGIVQTSYQCRDDRAVVAEASRVLDLRPVRELWVIPHTLLVLGRAQARLGDTDDARRSFERALTYEDYDWESNVRGRVEREMEKLEKQ